MQPKRRPLAQKSCSVSLRSYKERGRRYLAHAPKNMQEVLIDNALTVDLEDRGKGRSVWCVRILPNGKRIDLIAEEVYLVFLTELHEGDKCLT